ncbi:MAG TPA: ABC transporter ATP-binding protein [Vicinamibacterales bacterium]|jgi:ABC-2 type transport system ATP-binding protein
MEPSGASGVHTGVLEARSLTKYYSAIPAVRGVSFTLQPGGVLGLLGPNGSGKSTTVSILAGLLEPSGGTIELNGADIRDDLLGYKAKIGYVPEEAVLYTYLTGPEYLSLVGQLRGMSMRRIRSRIDGFLSLFTLRDDVHAPLSAYSKGMRQKILISAALLHDPAIVILDEPNSGLDVTTTLVLRSLVQALAAEGRMVIYSSHVLESVERVASDVIILNDGRVVAHDSVSQLRELLELPSLEQVFRQLVVETDIDRVARDLVAVMKL